MLGSPATSHPYMATCAQGIRETAPRTFDLAYVFGDIDEAVRAALENDQEVILTISGTPRWANGARIRTSRRGAWQISPAPRARSQRSTRAGSPPRTLKLCGAGRVCASLARSRETPPTRRPARRAPALVPRYVRQFPGSLGAGIGPQRPTEDRMETRRVFHGSAPIGSAPLENELAGRPACRRCPPDDLRHRPISPLRAQSCRPNR